MTVKLIETKKDSKDWKKIKALYLRAFPAVERLPFWLLKKKTQRRIAEFCSLYDDDEWVGFIYTLKNDSLAYVFFLAIDDTRRIRQQTDQAFDRALRRPCHRTQC
jgi:hypothetical protein